MKSMISREAVARDEFSTPVSPEGMRVMQVTADTTRDSHLDEQNTIRWTPDSRRFILRREAAKDGPAKPGVWLCDTDDGFALRPVQEWDEPLLPCFTPTPADAEGTLNECTRLNPDGSGLYEIRRSKGLLELRLIPLENGKARTLMTAPAPLAHSWADVSADGQHVALPIFMGDGKTEGAPWGLRVFDVKNNKTWVVELNNRARRGGRYRKGAGFRKDSGDGQVYDYGVRLGPSQLADGSWLTPPDGRWRWPNPPNNMEAEGCLHYVIRDDGSDRPDGPGSASRVIPLPPRPLFMGSHAAWRGSAADSFVLSMYNCTTTRWRVPFIESKPVLITEEDRKAGSQPEGGGWTDLSRFMSRADACHFDFDGSGRHLVSDTDGYVNPGPCMLYVGTYIEPENGEAPYLKTRLLGIMRTSWKTQSAHPHPLLSPDGRFALFQSDFSGRPQVHVAWGFEYP